MDFELLFRKHGDHIYDIFWETVERSLETRLHLLTGDKFPSYLGPKLERVSDAIYVKKWAMENALDL